MAQSSDINTSLCPAQSTVSPPTTHANPADDTLLSGPSEEPIKWRHDRLPEGSREYDPKSLNRFRAISRPDALSQLVEAYERVANNRFGGSRHIGSHQHRIFVEELHWDHLIQNIKECTSKLEGRGNMTKSSN
ncbi:hypothetical protein I302_104599 [Kwoniella bestiolae CBS 10118]|uniref:Uncharacterized protein n=1 Tax=Kwoniella bestiolae CBS 10118 TaxID=1296100 RepID=A0A1B9GBQ3_9TREE|nr:hypothetical protein I302_03305 [Kwoniella bestiolae CBS 10118]OCF28446.1 hypothetical protein I302_03305 [Kwoniella bestiolae CBS 10118]